MKWAMFGFIWLVLAIITLAVFHAMVSVRDMETIIFDDEEKD